MMISTVTHSAADTHALAERVGTLLRAGDVVVLAGELGAGKTVFAKGIARALGITEAVVSPTFTIVREYDAPLPLVHVDVYRLEHLQELHDLGFDDLVGGEAVTVVEWGDRVRAVLPGDRLDVQLDLGTDDDERRISMEPSGSVWAKRADALRALVDPPTPSANVTGSG
ncbi:MAG: tRNA (adenosine(37)-N6)-threonylcarbamoyltransferase complex ATPase subunit type 1 TsaE [Acidimicrobiia bacterium]